MRTLHQRRTHAEYVPGCFGCRVGTLQVGPAERSWASKQEDNWAKDDPAYVRLRKQGFQPPRTAGCAELEAGATHPVEIARGRVYKDKRMLSEAVDFVEQSFGQAVTTPMVDPVPRFVEAE